LPRVVITEGPGTGREFEFDEAAILGRLDTNDIPVHDAKASREHAKIYRQGGRFAIVDLNSSNGTFVNGDKITKRILEPGDVIEIGVVRLTFEDPEAELAKQAAATAGRKTLDEALGGTAAEKQAGAAGATGGGGGGGGEQIVMRGHQPIQVNRVKRGIGFDLDQFSDTARSIMYAVAVIVFLVLIYVGYLIAMGD
jgi:pSer/pThr/pTyr-binding forkhead associated (FHA) protein